MRASSARRRAATAVVSTGRPIPGSSGSRVHAPIGPAGAAAGVCAAATLAIIAPTQPPHRSRDRMGSEATAHRARRQLDGPSSPDANYAMTISSALTHAEAERLAARVADLERERKHLLAVIEILKEVSSSLHFIDILQTIAR